jgi:hypothetical protein
VELKFAYICTSAGWLRLVLQSRSSMDEVLAFCIQNTTQTKYRSSFPEQLIKTRQKHSLRLHIVGLKSLERIVPVVLPTAVIHRSVRVRVRSLLSAYEFSQ